MDENNINNLAKFLEKDDEVLLAFIFGSFASNKIKKDSDLDIAVLYRKPPQGFNVLNAINDLSKIAGREVHLAILNNASPLLKHQVMKNKINLAIKDRNLFVKFREKTISEYDEYKFISGMNVYDR